MEAFLAELTVLCNKHQVYIWGCGCCGSPTIESFNGLGHYTYNKENHYASLEFNIDERGI